MRLRRLLAARPSLLRSHLPCRAGYRAVRDTVPLQDIVPL
jgi:hypothetical protein